MEIKPSMFTDMPFNSILEKMECEIIARNIMIILKRTGDKFGNLTWEDYKKERLKDDAFDDTEQAYFNKVQYLSRGNKTQVLNFSATWKNSYIKYLENEKK